MQIETAYLSACGGREYNDDTVQIMEKEGGLCAFVGDGLGGYSGGRLASEAAAKAVMEEWKTGKLSGILLVMVEFCPTTKRQFAG